VNPEQQQIAIAEAHGMTNVSLKKGHDVYEEFKLFGDRGEGQEEVPDYLNDLNAMHEAEKVLKWEQRKQYHDLLADITGFSYCEADTQEETYLDWNCRICHATAEQRAEALLKTMGLWVEEDAL
jgi:cell division septum initiation protein DivIVA